MAKKSVSQHPSGGRQIRAKQPKVPQMELPPVPVENPTQDRVVYAVFATILLLGTLTTGLLYYFVGQNLYQAYLVKNWLNTALAAGALVGLLFFLRAAFTAAFVVSATVAGRTNAFSAQHKICTWALKYKSILPDRASWASQAIIQQMMAKQGFDQIIEFGTTQFEDITSKNPKDHSLAVLCTYVGMSYQAKGDLAKSIEWNEKSIDQFTKFFASIEKSKFAKKLGSQGVVEAMTLNYAQVLAGLGSSYMQQQNYRKAKDLLKQSLEQAKKTSETPERRQLIKQVEEGLGRLKRW
ncbi:MAG: tetratricopeptide repeat protein [Candidatus Obscuribacterales bacterium]|jgi:tetratricopeptide (TPR) repeat protein